MDKNSNGTGEMVSRYLEDAVSIPAVRPSFSKQDKIIYLPKDESSHPVRPSHRTGIAEADETLEEGQMYLDPEYVKAKREWDEWMKCDTDEKKRNFRSSHGLNKDEAPNSPEDIRSFKFLPLFKRIKI